MKTPQIPDNEPARLDALSRLEILDTHAEERFDRITRIAQHHFNVPIALVSLVDSTRQWFKSCQGLEASETPRDISFCGHAILNEEILYIPNALEDPRFADNPLVTGAPDIRFYAGAPLRVLSGERVGTLCIIDDQPHEFTAGELKVLRDLADMVEDQLQRTHLLRATRAMEESLKHYEAIIQSSDDAIISKTLDGIITSWNPGAERMFGFSADEVIGKPVLILFPPGRENEEKAILERLVRGEKVGHFETQRRRKDGSKIEISATISPIIDNDGRVIGVSKIARDITERKKLERMKTEFISTVSHELRTPLTSICGALNLVLGKADKGLQPRARKMLEMAERNSERLTLLINDILDLEKIESGRMAFEFKCLDLVALVSRAVEENLGFADKHEVNLALEAEPLKAMIRGDELRLLQILANLISNAVKYSPSGDTVQVSVQPYAGSCPEEGFRVAVCDHGPGIPKHFRRRIFQRFAQADSSDTREKGGTGLGLSISKAIVERHNGKIGYQIEEGVGTTFYFDLPAWPERSEAVAATPVTARALICEDNPDIARILSDLIALEGVVSDIAGTAAAAQALLAENSYQLMLLDLELPDSDGLQLLRVLREDPATAELPVIVVSARAEQGRVMFNGNGVAVVDWLQKPVERQRLEQALRKTLSRAARPRILHVEDDPDVIQVVQALLDDIADFKHVESLQAARLQISRERFDLVILDLELADGCGAELLAELRGCCPVVIFSAQVPSQYICDQVATALLKSMTSNDELRTIIKNILDTQGT